MLRTQRRRLRKQSLNKSLTSYRQSITAAARGLYRGDLDIFDFTDAMFSAIDRGYEQAWQEGAKVCGIKPDERTPVEMSELANFIAIAKSSVFGFGEYIQEAESFPSSRIDVWAKRYGEVKNKAQAMACSDTKARWDLGKTEKHCVTCSGLNGRVYRMSVWEANALPQGRRLACGGWKCDCRLTPTQDKITPGKFPASLLG